MSLSVLVVAHGHPKFSKGGAEIAAYQLFRALSEREDCAAWLLARQEGSNTSANQRPLEPMEPGSREFLYHQDSDSFDFSVTHPGRLARDLRALLSSLRPDVVHFHQYLHIGIETFSLVRNCLPGSRILLTLHELLAICPSQGLMVKSSGRLCEHPDPYECHRCVPERDPEDFLLRQRYIKSCLSVVDHFISPSRFLRERYIDWGLPPEKILVLENGQPEVQPAPFRSAGRDADVVFGYFGQITPFKGLDILVDAFSRLKQRHRRRARLEIHGGGQERFGARFDRSMRKALRRAPEGVLHCGAYAPEELPTRMAGVDCVVLPSLAWENSPMVIQEAMLHRRPVICSDVGGMAEKVTDGIDGLHFSVGDADALARTLQRLICEPGLIARLREGIRPPPTITETASSCVRIYRG